MKQCPQCHDVYPDEGLKFCGRDGSPLVDLSQAVGGFASLPVSPSEIVLLHGEQFAGPGDSTVVKVPTSGALVDAVQLARMILAAMVLGCEQAGSIRLQAGPTGGCLLVSEGPIRNVRWQEWSLEYRLCGIMGQGINRQLPHLIAQLWQRDFRAQFGEAWIHAGTLVLQGLASRNLISAAPDFSATSASHLHCLRFRAKKQPNHSRICLVKCRRSAQTSGPPCKEISRSASTNALGGAVWESIFN
jgi:hypothetical protein